MTVFSRLQATTFSNALNPKAYTLMRLIYGFFWAKRGVLAGSAKARRMEKGIQKEDACFKLKF